MINPATFSAVANAMAASMSTRLSRSAMADSISVRFDGAEADAALAELQAELEAMVRPIAQAGAQVLYDEVKARVAGLGRVTGNLDESIYQVYSKDNSGAGNATYHVSWNHVKAPHGRLVEYGHIQRYVVFIAPDGSWRTAVRPAMRGKPRPKRRASQAEKDAYYVTLAQPHRVAAKPFLRPAWDAKGAAAAEAMQVRYTEGMQRLLGRLK